ncbi:MULTISPECIES: DUF5134 domain-containing protein [unclassified Micromonospora]|uniref:DUF5134 domain-containing protein n=1 Tax=unclassified Micromonospora TaxID=2617518 RepID=UPI0022B6BA40|nr:MULTISPECIES: DUF5134 domain-containing protein [unclassified Micromonospora]MCZ7418653.1 DUF5134 domain-containing protein [Verrucosispora sp. WMMA2121]WBB92356.1 DUF5134 domain-containing protein [Verrucosispora sp. WMMC514]
MTVVFLLTGLVCVADLVVRRRAVSRDQPFSDEELVGINHGVMSAAMILMVWVMVEGAVAWAQIAVFAILALALLPAYRRTRHASDRADLVSHAAMDVAMIWMLAAMPTLMSELGTGGAGGGHSHGGGASGGVPVPTPAWADTVNIAFVVLAAATALWWLYRTMTASRHRLHSLSYSVMAAGMGTMLLLMNV